MMTQARFSIGIDLGTTNCALAFVPLHGEARSAIFGVPQWASLSAITESTALPSFLYLPEEAARCPNTGRGGQERGMDCRPARTQKGRSIAWPGRPFREVLALSPHVRSLGAVSALGIGRHRSQPQNFTGTRLGAYPQPSQASLEQAVCRCRCRLRF